MKAQKIPSQESKFANELTDVSGTKFKVTGVEAINGSEIVKVNPGYDTYYYSKKYKKTKIVIHNTVGTLRGDMAALTKDNFHVSTPYVIARNGTIYEIFNPEFWSYHLGKGAVGGNKTNSTKSIAIELSSYGPLKRVGDNLETMYSEVTYTDSKGNNKRTKKDVYCSMLEKSEYTELSIPFRGHRYFAGYTDAQMKSLKALIEYLSEKFNIPKTILDESTRYELFSSSADARNFTGVCSHVNFIGVGKWDIGPEMDWSYLFTDEAPVPTIEPEEKEPEATQEEMIFDDYAVEEEPPKKVRKFSFMVFILNIVKKFITR
jgi:N-acetyl-anhydromuramyl-L-alanine amidase AmpD